MIVNKNNIINKIDKEDEIVQYYIVNSELNMSVGKIASQTAHVATIITSFHHYNNPLFDIWFRFEQKKIILRGKQKDLERAIKDGAYYIRDLGCTEVDKDSLTVCAFQPMFTRDIPKYAKRLQIL